jgi:protein gp37
MPENDEVIDNTSKIWSDYPAGYIVAAGQKFNITATGAVDSVLYINGKKSSFIQGYTFSSEIYAKDNPVSYVGQIITVIENNKITNYQIINENGDLSELVNASEIKNKINTLSESISNINIDSINNIDDIKNILSSIVTSLKNFSK